MLSVRLLFCTHRYLRHRGCSAQAGHTEPGPLNNHQLSQLFFAPAHADANPFFALSLRERAGVRAISGKSGPHPRSLSRRERDVKKRRRSLRASLRSRGITPSLEGTKKPRRSKPAGVFRLEDRNASSSSEWRKTYVKSFSMCAHRRAPLRSRNAQNARPAAGRAVSCISWS